MNTVNSAEETHDEVTEESNDIEDVLQSAVLQSVEINMDISEDESGDCILEDVLLIDSVDGADAETSPTIETENDSKPGGINSLYYIKLHTFINSHNV